MAKNDLHGHEGKGYHAFDLDGTLAKYDGWKGWQHIGEPVKRMVDLAKKFHANGEEVRIITARLSPASVPPGTKPGEGTLEDDRRVITEWCKKHLGFVPSMSCEKDALMIDMYDDRCKQVIPNEGILIEDILRENDEKKAKKYLEMI